MARFELRPVRVGGYPAVMGERGAVKTHLHGRLNLPSVMVVLWVFRRATKRQDRDRPEIVSLNAKSKPVLDHAQQLARDGREDAQAVAELRALASNRRRTLRRAERASRFGGYHHEQRQANLAHRLLEAAVTRNPVAGISPEHQKRIETVEAFDSLSLSEQWAGLTILQPLLIDLEADVQAGRFGEIRKFPPGVGGRGDSTDSTSPADEDSRQVSLSSSNPPFTEEEIRQIGEHGRRHNELIERLKSLVGPDSPDGDLLLNSQRAFEAARFYLLHPSD